MDQPKAKRRSLIFGGGFGNKPQLNSMAGANIPSSIGGLNPLSINPTSTLPHLSSLKTLATLPRGGTSSSSKSKRNSKSFQDNNLFLVNPAFNDGTIKPVAISDYDDPLSLHPLPQLNTDSDIVDIKISSSSSVQNLSVQNPTTSLVAPSTGHNNKHIPSFHLTKNVTSTLSKLNNNDDGVDDDNPTADNPFDYCTLPRATLLNSSENIRKIPPPKPTRTTTTSIGDKNKTKMDAIIPLSSFRLIPRANQKVSPLMHSEEKDALPPPPPPENTSTNNATQRFSTSSTASTNGGGSDAGSSSGDNPSTTSSLYYVDCSRLNSNNDSSNDHRKTPDNNNSDETISNRSSATSSTITDGSSNHHHEHDNNQNLPPPPDMLLRDDDDDEQLTPTNKYPQQHKQTQPLQTKTSITDFLPPLPPIGTVGDYHSLSTLQRQRRQQQKLSSFQQNNSQFSPSQSSNSTLVQPVIYSTGSLSSFQQQGSNSRSGTLRKPPPPPPPPRPYPGPSGPSSDGCSVKSSSNCSSASVSSSYVDPSTISIASSSPIDNLTMSTNPATATPSPTVEDLGGQHTQPPTVATVVVGKGVPTQSLSVMNQHNSRLFNRNSSPTYGWVYHHQQQMSPPGMEFDAKRCDSLSLEADSSGSGGQPNSLESGDSRQPLSHSFDPNNNKSSTGNYVYRNKMFQPEMDSGGRDDDDDDNGAGTTKARIIDQSYKMFYDSPDDSVMITGLPSTNKDGFAATNKKKNKKSSQKYVTPEIPVIRRKENCCKRFCRSMVIILTLVLLIFLLFLICTTLYNRYVLNEDDLNPVHSIERILQHLFGWAPSEAPTSTTALPMGHSTTVPPTHTTPISSIFSSLSTTVTILMNTWNLTTASGVGSANSDDPITTIPMHVSTESPKTIEQTSISTPQPTTKTTTIKHEEQSTLFDGGDVASPKLVPSSTAATMTIPAANSAANVPIETVTVSAIATYPSTTIIIPASTGTISGSTETENPEKTLPTTNFTSMTIQSTTTNSTVLPTEKPTFNGNNNKNDLERHQQVIGNQPGRTTPMTTFVSSQTLGTTSIKPDDDQMANTKNQDETNWTVTETVRIESPLVTTNSPLMDDQTLTTSPPVATIVYDDTVEGFVVRNRPTPTTTTSRPSTMVQTINNQPTTTNHGHFETTLFTIQQSRSTRSLNFDNDELTNKLITNDRQMEIQTTPLGTFSTDSTTMEPTLKQRATTTSIKQLSSDDHST